MRVQIRHLLTPDIDPTTFAPEDPERFMFMVQMLARPSDGPGEESFQFIVCTPGWLQDQVDRDGPMPGAHHVIVGTFDWPALKTFFQRLVSQCAGADWNEAATKLSRYSLYEFAHRTA
ncbi:Imm8 family immunity protein [Streptacidiphilus sp. EB129]|jgi:hypothetical protein|uniref:Imm8 family immunity protein n=1 Tax=Streptacidiphilus sp. EB129 TaxID=3156262 RepID=UPI0035123F62